MAKIRLTDDDDV